MNKTENITFVQTQVSYKSQASDKEVVVAPVAETSVPKKQTQLMTNLNSSLLPATPAPTPVIFPTGEDVPVTYTLAPSTNASENEKREEEMRKRLMNMTQVINGLTQYAMKEAAKDSEAASAMAEPSADVKKAAFDMVGYMIAMMNAMIETMSNQAAVGQESANMSAVMTTLAKAQLAQAQADMARVAKEEYDESHRSFWDKLWSAIKSIGDAVFLPFAFLEGASGENVGDAYKAAFEQFCQDNQESGGFFTALTSIMMIVLSPFCGGTSLALMGVFMISMQVSGGQEKLDNWINSICANVGGQLALQIFVALIEAVVLAEVAGVIDSAVGATTKEALSKAATVGASIAKTAGNVAGDASGLSRLLGSLRSVASKAEDEGIEMVNRGAEVAADEAEEIDASIAASDSAQTTLRTILENGTKKAFGDSLKKALVSVTGKTLVQTSANNFWSKLLTALGADDEISALVGAALGLCVALAGMKMDATQGSGDLAIQLEKAFGEQTFHDLKMTLSAMTSIFALEQSSYLILQGLKQLDIGDTLLDLSKAQGIQALLSDVIDRLQTISAQNNSSVTSNAKSYEEVNSNMKTAFDDAWNAFI